MDSARDRAAITAERWRQWSLFVIAMSYPHGQQAAAVQRQARERAKTMARAEALKAKESGAKNGGV